MQDEHFTTHSLNPQIPVYLQDYFIRVIFLGIFHCDECLGYHSDKLHDLTFSKFLRHIFHKMMLQFLKVMPLAENEVIKLNYFLLPVKT